MDPDDVKRRIQDYVRKRMKEEADTGKRGGRSDLAKALDVSSAHVSNILNHNRSAEFDMWAKLAAHWGMTFPEFVVAAMGDPPPAAMQKDPPIGMLLKRWGSIKGLRAAIDDEKNSHWRTSTIVQATMSEWDSPDGEPRGGWSEMFSRLESGALKPEADTSREASRISKKKAGRRIRLPKEAK